MDKIIQKAVELQNVGNYSQLARLLEWQMKEEIGKKRQDLFSNYIKNGSRQGQSIKPCIYGTTPELQVFGNDSSLYVVNKKFILTDEIKITNPPFFLNKNDLQLLIDRYERLMKYARMTHIKEEEFAKDRITIDTMVNMATFPTQELLLIIELLGHIGLEYKLSNNHPLLKVRSRNGSVYLRGNKKCYL